MMNLFAQGIKANEGMLQDTVADAFNFKPIIEPTTSTASASDGYIPDNSVVNVTMNIYGAKGQDVKELADEISRKLGLDNRRIAAVWA
jgi:hypothetical protein